MSNYKNDLEYFYKILKFEFYLIFTMWLCFIDFMGNLTTITLYSMESIGTHLPVMILCLKPASVWYSQQTWRFWLVFEVYFRMWSILGKFKLIQSLLLFDTGITPSSFVKYPHTSICQIYLVCISIALFLHNNFIIEILQVQIGEIFSWNQTLSKWQCHNYTVGKSGYVLCTKTKCIWRFCYNHLQCLVK